MIVQMDSEDLPDQSGAFQECPATIELQQVDYAINVEIAKLRNWESITKGLKDTGTATREREMDMHIVGCCGEYALALLLDKAWNPGVNVFRSRPDVGEEEVRARVKGEMEIFYTSRDEGNHRYWLVTGRPPFLTVQGWARLEDLKAVPLRDGDKKAVRCPGGLMKYYVHNKHLKLYIPVVSKHWMVNPAQAQLPLGGIKSVEPQA
jgi:hypothetical protein